MITTEYALGYPVRIEVCGAIASGKTTLVSKIAPKLAATAVYENFRDNPFWSRFYAQPDKFRPEKDLSFLAHHTGEIKAASGSLIVCDYAPIQDLAYARLAHDSAHFEMMQIVYRQLYRMLPKPSLIVHLRCDAKELVRRIRARGRTEEVDIDAAYLESLSEFLMQLLNRSELPVFEVSSDKVNFVSDEDETSTLYSEIVQRLVASTSSSRSTHDLKTPHSR